ncbi:DUF3168 domain-containing protein [Tranquillimonas alkanivorans]|uniref:Gene transfer agent protein n=1 Tax=Tranquillimonas alkanivorans TaxID=441119 RepID=A0A1I5QS54_9RHOB|nr:DUF3168 domain-containing protein [Tranquillimonas alkanivorans]SFP48897.1 Protein of unknown function [Tranquillimonas alkanivorans]
MSYGMAGVLQEAVFQRLRGDTALQALVGAEVFDAVPGGTLPATYVVVGEEDVRDRSDATGGGARHDFTVSVVSDASGFATAKAAAGAVSDALVDAGLTLARGRLVGLWFLRAKADRTGAGDGRRIDLRFRARVEDEEEA